MRISIISLLILIATTSAVISPPAFAVAGLLSELFPMVNVTITNNVTHPVSYMCNTEALRDKLHVIEPGEAIQWELRDVAFPLVWCYLHINEYIQGVFWAFIPKYRCDRHCDWWVQEEGMYLHTKYGEQYIWLYQDGEFF